MLPVRSQATYSAFLCTQPQQKGQIALSFGERALISKLVNHSDRAVAELRTEQNLNRLRRAALMAFCTPLPIVQAIWEALAQLGFRNFLSFHMLEPAADTDNVISAMPLAPGEQA